MLVRVQRHVSVAESSDLRQNGECEHGSGRFRSLLGVFVLESQ